MKSRRIAAAVLFAFLPATVSLPAWSQDDAVTVQARARFKEGVEAFDKGKFEEARLAFLQAYTLKKHPSVLLNLAQSSAKANHLLDASKYFQQFLREASTATPQQRKDAEAGLAEVRQKLARIEVVAPAGTEISLDDQGKVGTTPMDPLDVEPGSHTVKSPTQSVTVIAVTGQKVEAKLGGVSPTAAPITAPAAEPAGTGESPQQVTPPRDGGTTHAKRTNLLAPPENMIPVYAGLGAAGVGLVSAIAFALFKSDAQSKADTVAGDIRDAARLRGVPAQGVCNDPNQPDFADACQTLKDNNSKVDTNATIANVSLVVMGVGLAVAGVWYLAGPKRDDARPAEPAQGKRSPTRPLVTPWAGWNSGGLSVAGEF
ncbi:MAG: hypothetical protein KF850_12625 [Labilithrix sp.]|nr:hypothetical protein [Labilithrix sp.]